jgi:hypothetical protein
VDTIRFIAAVAALAIFCVPVVADGDRCAICGGELSGTIYFVTDKVTDEKKQICQNCSSLTETCFLCGLPVKTDYTKLPDGRFLCARDARNAVLNEDEAKQVCEDVREALDRQFVRFLTFPSTNLQIEIIDRVNLLEMFKFPGNDYQCPVTLGYIQSELSAKERTRGQIKHHISLMSALPRAQFKAVCAHELTHAWLYENLPAQRRKTLGHDANEGFCELVAFLLIDAQHEEEQKKVILRNNYTRGQIHLFIEAEKRFGFNEITEWMKYGVDAVLNKNDLNNVRKIELPDSHPPGVGEFSILPPKTRTPDRLILRGISWRQDRPLAIINDRTFGIKERGSVRVGNTNLVIRCLEISRNSVVVQIEGRTDKQVLELNEP